MTVDSADLDLRPSLAGNAHVLIAGTSRHIESSRLADVPAVAYTVSALRETLTRRCSVPDASIRTVLDAPSPLELGDALAEVCRRAGKGDVLLVCFAGHGLTNASGELFLATSASIGEGSAAPVDHRALPYSMLRSYVGGSRASSKVVILDCCYSGRATGRVAAAREFADLTEIANSYVLTAAGRTTLAVASDDSPHTAFLGELIEWLHKGEPGGERKLSLDGAFRHLSGKLPAMGCPRPMRSVTDLAGDLVLAPNPLWRPVPQPRPDEPPMPPPAPSDMCPYPGLASFTEREFGTFHGRSTVVEGLLRSLERRWTEPAPLVVYGASGCGKSSLLRAGLLPAVARGRLKLPAAADWPRLVLTPTADPVASVASALAPLLDEDETSVAQRLAEDPDHLAELLGRLSPDGSGVLLVVDQFEEVFTQCPDEPSRQWLISAVDRAAAGAAGSPTALVVLGVRADFNGRLVDYPALAPAMSSPFLLGPMTAEQISEAVERPARDHGLRLQPGLVELILDDLEVGKAQDEAGRLPLLAHALRETWRRRDDGVLTIDSYKRTGRIAGALAETANRALDELGPDAVDDARLVLLRLVRIGDGTRDTRTGMSEERLLAGLPDPAHGRAVLDTFSRDDTRLVTRDVERVQITHEALLDAWPRLREWLAEDRAGLLVGQRLDDAARQWHAEGRRASDLHRGGRLQLELEWAKNPDHALDDVRRDFLAAGVKQEAAERRSARRRVRVLGAGSLVLAGLLVFSLVQWRSAEHQRDIISQQRRTAVARSLAAQADAVRDDTPTTALRLNLAAERVWSAPETRAALSEAVAGFGAERTLLGHRDAVRRVAVSPDSTLLAGGGNDGRVLLWNIADPAHPVREAVLDLGDVRVAGLSFSPDGRTLASDGPDGTILLWSLKDPAHPVRAGVLRGPFGAGGTLEFAPHENILAVDGKANEKTDGQADGSADFKASTVELWDVSSPSAPRRLKTLPASPQDIVYTVAFSSDGRTMASGSRDGLIRLWDVTDIARPRKITELNQHTAVTSLALSADGRLLALASGNDAKPQLWSLAEPERPERLASLPGPAITATTVTFSPDGRTLAASGADRTTVLWDITRPSSPRELATPVGHDNPVSDLAFTGDGQWLFTGSYDTTVRVWPLTDWRTPHREAPLTLGKPGSLTAEAAAQAPDGHTLAVGGYGGGLSLWTRDSASTAPRLAWKGSSDQQGVIAAEFSPDGRTLATAGYDGTTRLWLTTDPQHPRAVGRLAEHTDYVQSVAFSPDGRTLATAGHDRRLVLWDITRPDRPRRLTVLSRTAAVGYARFAPDGRTLLIGTADNKYPLSAWDLTTRERPRLLSRFPGFSGSVFAVALSRNSGRMAVASGDGNVQVWDLSDPRGPRRLATVQAHKGIATSVALSADGRLLYSGGYEDKSVKVWNLTTPKSPAPLTTLPAPGPVNTMALADTRHSLVVGTEGGSAVVWDTTDFAAYLSRPQRLACDRVGRGPTAKEWRALTGGLAYDDPCPPE
ncbi:WD40 repeat domain-containing protein [Streptomyces sp. SID13726]|uniref:WD40 repeat domain-containing protein n=1 Tax=Streptomyces sp. SID13726 TaxID=2706058 RepID=UPI0013BC0F24|nr:WD40 repeat domain-containing protein [Streptomyces sp. SID13726]NEA99128.1 hypothetical protein [Streptomyces sp. SID13726]